MTAVHARRSAAETREHVLAVTADLFYWHGIRATGVDRVAAVAGVAPTTLYRLFASKDDLVGAYLERAEAGYLEWLDSAAGAAGDRVGAVFAALLDVTAPAGFRGCPFLMALAEFPDPAHPAHVRARRTKAAVRERMHRLTGELGVADPGRLADQLMLVMEGVYGAVPAHGDLGPAAQAPAVAAALVAAAQARP